MRNAHRIYWVGYITIWAHDTAMISRLQFANDYYDLQAIEMFLSLFLFFQTE